MGETGAVKKLARTYIVAETVVGALIPHDDPHTTAHRAEQEETEENIPHPRVTPPPLPWAGEDGTWMDPKPKPTEDKRKALVEKWDRPSENPGYRGLTPQEVARALKPASRKNAKGKADHK